MNFSPHTKKNNPLLEYPLPPSTEKRDGNVSGVSGKTLHIPSTGATSKDRPYWKQSGQWDCGSEKDSLVITSLQDYVHMVQVHQYEKGNA